MKEIPYFRFTVAEWLNADISLEDLETKGLFMDVCAYYWFNTCKMTQGRLKRRFDRHQATLEKLFKAGFLKVEPDGETVKINYLDEQLDLLIKRTETLSKAGKNGYLEKLRQAKGGLKGGLSYKDKDKDKEYYTQKFNLFWSSYPRRNGNLVGKTASRDLFEKIPKEEIETLLQHVKNYSEKVDHKFVKDPERFLKKDFWKDWFEPAQEKIKPKDFLTIQEQDDYLTELGYEKYIEFLKKRDIKPMLNAKGEVI
jgi:hypothetical protein